MDFTKCCFENCQSKARGTLLDGKPYCFKHYDELISNEFEREWSSWGDNMFPPQRLLYLCGRFLNEKRWTTLNGLMTNARLCDRGFNFQKDETGFTFEITRHPNAMKNGYVTERVVEKWKVSLQDRLVERIGERPWTEKDFDI